MQIALLGFGTIGEARARLYRAMDEVELVAVADPTPARRARASHVAPGVACYPDVETLLRERSPDAVDICSPPAYHEEQIRLALEHGCHVLCEKPLLTRTSPLESLVALARTGGRVLYPAHNYRFSPALRFLEGALRAGSLGEPLRGRFRIVRTGYALGVSEWHPNWRRDPVVAGGGILTDHGTHCIYLASHLSGAWPHAVSCTIDGNGACEETARLELEIGSLSWSVDLTWAGEARRNYYALEGSAGSAVVDDDRGYLYANGNSSTQRLPSASLDPTHSDWFPALFADFRRAISDVAGARRSLAEAVATVITLDRAYVSAAMGGRRLAIELPALCYEPASLAGPGSS